MGWRLNRNASRALVRLARTISLGCLATTSFAAQPAPDANRKAYDYAMRCFVAGTVAVSDKRVNIDAATDTAMRQAAKRAYDATYAMGKVLGYARSRVKSELDTVTAVEGRMMLRDEAFFERTRTQCVQLGMMQ
jgi:hypothetical protein